MWITPEDGRRYQTLTHAIEASLNAKGGRASGEVVEVEDLAAFLEWMSLAREVAPSLQPFVERSSPGALQNFSYSQMMRYFRYLRF